MYGFLWSMILRVSWLPSTFLLFSRVQRCKGQKGIVACSVIALLWIYFLEVCNLSNSGSTFLFSSFSNERCELTYAYTYKMIGMHYALPGLVYAVNTMHKYISDKAKKSRVHIYQVSVSGKYDMIILAPVGFYIPIICSNCHFNCSNTFIS